MSDSNTLIAYLQIHLQPLDTLLRALSEYVYIEYYLLVCVILFWCGFRVIAARLSCLTLFSTVLFTGLKQFFLSSRPYIDHPELFNGWRENQWGMPSGHSQNAMVFWGTVAINISIKVFRVLAILLILSIGISRLYLGVHYLSQVLAGFMIGLIILYISYQYEQRFCHWVSKLHFIQKVITLFLLVHMPWLLIAAVHSVLDMGSDAQLPYNRLSFYSGILFGIALSLSTSPNGTPCSQPWKIVVLVLTKALPGFIVIYYLWQLKNQLPELLQNVSTPSLHYVAFWLLGLCISLWACWLWPTIHKYFFRNNCLYPEN